MCRQLSCAANFQPIFTRGRRFNKTFEFLGIDVLKTRFTIESIIYETKIRCKCAELKLIQSDENWKPPRYFAASVSRWKLSDRIECFDYFLWDVVNEVGEEKSSRRITEGIEKFPFNEDETFTKMLILSRIRRIRPVVYELYIANIAKKWNRIDLDLFILNLTEFHVEMISNMRRGYGYKLVKFGFTILPGYTLAQYEWLTLELQHPLQRLRLTTDAFDLQTGTTYRVIGHVPICTHYSSRAHAVPEL